MRMEGIGKTVDVTSSISPLATETVECSFDYDVEL